MNRAAHRPLTAVDLVRHAAYQEALVRLMRALTTTDGQGHMIEALDDSAAYDAIVKFRRAHGLVVPDCEPLYFVAGLHRARIRHRAMTADEINYSEHWLIRRGYGCAVDTEFNPKPAKPDDGRQRTDD